MRNSIIFFLFILFIISTSCSEKPKQVEGNPLLAEFDTPFGVPPFDKIQSSDFKPALDSGIVALQQEIESIANNTEEPTFENTIEALEYTGSLLRKVESVFDNLNSANTNESIQDIAKQVAPAISKVNDDKYLNEKLFDRINKVYQSRSSLELYPEQRKLLEETYKDFVKRGANLSEEDKSRLREINERLSVLSLEFGENVLKETNNFQLIIEDESQLAGLPDNVIQSAAEAAKNEGMEEKWLITMHKPSFIPFLQYSEVRLLREKVFKGYMKLGDNNNEFDNKEIIKESANLRLEKANLLGFETYADYMLSDRMAGSPQNVYDLLGKIWESALPMAKKEASMMQEMITQDGENFKLEPWDWWYYAEKIRQEKFALNEEELRPYFELENVKKGLFGLATSLYGITFEERKELPVPHPDAVAYEVKNADGSHIGILYVDYFPRASKEGGAWMSSFRKQHKTNGENVAPVITNVMNFSKPTGDKPALLSVEEVQTMFHEFGHGLHGLLSQCTYESLSGTAVAQDFVELPSQIMENWVLEPEMLKKYAKHYQTGEVIPDSLIAKIKDSGTFNQGFAMTEYLAASILDMDYHTIKEPITGSVTDFENKSMANFGLIDEIIPRYRSTYFRHIFAGGYSAGYYSYMWAEVLDADAYEAFKENGIFDKETATSFRDNILARGGTEDAMKLYKEFRGAEPQIGPMLERRGIVK